MLTITLRFYEIYIASAQFFGYERLKKYLIDCNVPVSKNRKRAISLHLNPQSGELPEVATKKS